MIERIMKDHNQTHSSTSYDTKEEKLKELLKEGSLSMKNGNSWSSFHKQKGFRW